jgi:hypothetical protein
MNLDMTTERQWWVAFVKVDEPVRVYIREVRVLNEEARVVISESGDVRTLYAFERSFDSKKAAQLWVADELHRAADGIRNMASQYAHLAHAVETVLTEEGEEVRI